MRIRTLVSGTLLIISTVALIAAQTGREVFRDCRAKDAIDNDARGAMECFERVIRDFPSDRALLADARLALARLTETTDAAKAKQLYELVSTSDQPLQAAEARKLLEGLSRNPFPEIKIPTPFADDPYSFAISPDGLSVVYQSTVGGKGQLWLWRDSKVAPIKGTDNARQFALPFWSPDGRKIGFFADRKLKTVAVEGGEPRILAEVPLLPRGGTWNEAGVIVFAQFSGPLQRVSATGDEMPTAIPQGNSLYNHYPRFLPDGQRFVYRQVNGATFMTNIGSLDGSVTKPFLSGAGASFVPPDRWYFANAGRVVSIVPDTAPLAEQRVDIARLEFIGNPVNLGISVALDTRRPALAALSVSSKGAIAFRSEVGAPRQLTYLDRTGRETAVLGSADKAVPCCMRFSADGGTLGYYRSTGGAGTLWMMDAATGQRFQFREAVLLAFSPDGSEVVWSGIRGSGLALFRQPLNLLKGNQELVAQRQEGLYVQDVSADGHVLFGRPTPNPDLLAMPDKGGETIPVAVGPGAEQNGRFSPDSKWVAYESDEIDGRFEVFIQPFGILNSSPRRVSLGGGTLPQWSRDGRQLYFLSADDHVMVVDVTLGAQLEHSTPRPLFATPLRHGSTFEFHPDGQRLLVNSPTEDVPPIILLPNGPKRP